MATKKKKKMAVVALPSPLTVAEIDEGIRKVLFMLSDKIRKYTELEDVSKLKINYGEYKPLKPVYTEESSDSVGYIQRGPHTTTIIIEDFTNDGQLTRIG